jgi:hypothetical protein
MQKVLFLCDWPHYWICTQPQAENLTVVVYLPWPFSCLAPLVLLTYLIHEEQHAVIRFLWGRVVRGAEIHHRLPAQYGNSVLWQWSLYKWIDMFRSNWTSVTDAEWSQCLFTSTTKGNIEQIVFWILGTEWWLSVKWKTGCRVVTVLPMKSTVTEFTSIKFVQDDSLATHEWHWHNCLDGYL